MKQSGIYKGWFRTCRGFRRQNSISRRKRYSLRSELIFFAIPISVSLGNHRGIDGGLACSTDLRARQPRKSSRDLHILKNQKGTTGIVKIHCSRFLIFLCDLQQLQESFDEATTPIPLIQIPSGFLRCFSATFCSHQSRGLPHHFSQGG